jgi:hypothetical protein
MLDSLSQRISVRAALLGGHANVTRRVASSTAMLGNISAGAPGTVTALYVISMDLPVCLIQGTVMGILDGARTNASSWFLTAFN